MCPNSEEKNVMLRLLADQIEVMTSTLDILDQCTRGRLSGKDAEIQLKSIEEKFIAAKRLRRIIV